MKESFNLINQAWIPCVMPDGKTKSLGFLETLASAHEISDMGLDNPIQYVGLFRVLLAILHRNFGPEETKDWKRLWQSGAFNRKQLITYFKQWEKRFNLFDQTKPFYQTIEITTEPRPINDLTFQLAIYQMASGNATLFNHHTDFEEIIWQPAEAAIQLVTAQSFGIGFRQFKDGPSARGINYILKGNNLFKTLVLNLIRYDDRNNDSFRENGEDRPAWEQETPFQPERKKPIGYLDYLTWQSRKVLLISDDNNKTVSKACMDVGQKLNISSEPYCFNPMWIYRENPKPVEKSPPFFPRKFEEGRSLWRDSTTLINTKKAQHKPLAAIEWIKQMQISDDELNITAKGMASDQGKVNFYMEELFVFPSVYIFKEYLTGDLETCMEQAGQVRDKLWGAVNHMAEVFLASESDQQEGHKPDKKDVNDLWEHLFTEGIFWAALELPFYELVMTLPINEESAMDDWQTVLKKTARQALEQAQVSLGNSPKALKAAAKSNTLLLGGLKKLFQS